MKTITYNKLIEIAPYKNDITHQLKGYFEANPNMSALDMLGLNEVDIEDRFWAVLREELIPANTLHEFACLCAERALAKVGNPDQRSVAAIAAKRKWMRGEITNEKLEKARDAARDATWAASDAARDAARDAFRAASTVASLAAMGAARNEERAWQLDTLIKLLEKEDKQ